MHILITGGLGQLGRALQSVLAKHELTIIDLPDVDVTDRKAVEASFRAAAPDLVIHCAAYTDVEGCARNPELAHTVNGLGTQNVALTCRLIGAPMLHVSTNEVFAGDNPAGYQEWMTPRPINPYGHSKAAAEFYVRSLLHRYYIVRTAWLYSPTGRNFIHAILGRAGTTSTLRVVTDEIGSPTYANDLAWAISELIATRQYGIYHFTNAGSCSRWSFANEILRLAGLDQVTNMPILVRDYKRASMPPPFSILHNVAGAAIGITLRPWQDALAEFMRDHVDGNT